MQIKFRICFLLLIVMITLNSCSKEQSLKKQSISELKENKTNNYEMTNKDLIKQKNKTVVVAPSNTEPTCEFLRSKDVKLEPEPLNNEFNNKIYSYMVNSNWRNFIEDLKDSFPGESYYSLEGRDFPAFFNEGPVIANVWSITETKYKDLEAAKKDWIEGITINPDRDFTDVPEKQV